MAKCEWNPVLNCKATEGSDTACANEAVVSVGARGQWHLCLSCSELPPFRKYRRRVFLTPAKDRG